MIRFALCDDNQGALQSLKEKIELLMKKDYPKEPFFIYMYSSSTELELQMTEHDIADIFILDVDMPVLNGFQLARHIQDCNAGAVLFFVSSHMEMASQGYSVHALRYVDKLHIEEELKPALDAAIQMTLERHEKYLLVNFDRITQRVLLDQIYCGVIENRKLMLYVRDETDPIRDKRGIQEVMEALNDLRFVQIHRGAFVNADYVKKIGTDSVELLNGMTLMASRRQLPEARRAIFRWWGQNI